MVNEFAYCPRLFYLEWVQRRFVDNTDTVQGRWSHRVVDRETLADPDQADTPTVVRSLPLASERLGLSCRADLVEFDGDRAVPIDYKRGSPPANPEQSWEPERIQLCVQALLLREHGYECEEGFLYFTGARKRVRVRFTEDLVNRTAEIAESIRHVALQDQAPAPLIDSPRCPRCSLVGLCMPDETNMLQQRLTSRPRRLIPSDESGRPLYVTEPGARVGRSRGRVEVTRDGERLASVRAVDVSQVCVFGNVQVSTQLVNQLLRDGTPVCWFSYGGWFNGMAHNPPTGHVELRMRQVAVAMAGDAAIASEVVRSKVMNCRTLLMRNARARPDGEIGDLKKLAHTASRTTSVTSLLGLEGAAARTYFSVFTSMLRPDEGLDVALSFERRSRRPPPDILNALLSFCYSLLVKDVTATLHTVGLDPFIGFYHRPRFGRPALALDLCEEFRPLIADSVVIRLVNNREVDSGSFIMRAGGVALTKPGRRAVLRAYERRLAQEVTHPLFGYKVSYRRVLEVQGRLLASYLVGELPSYQGFTTR